MKRSQRPIPRVGDRITHCSVRYSSKFSCTAQPELAMSEVIAVVGYWGRDVCRCQHHRRPKTFRFHGFTHWAAEEFGTWQSIFETLSARFRGRSFIIAVV